MKIWWTPNEATSPDAAVALWLRFGDHWRGTGEFFRWATQLYA